MAGERTIELSFITILFSLIGFLISTSIDNNRYREKPVQISFREDKVWVRSNTDVCHSGEGQYPCDEMIRRRSVGGCYDPVNVSCLGYYYWMDDYGYQHSLFYPKGGRNYKARSIIMEKIVWNVNINDQKIVCQDWGCVLDWNKSSVVVDTKTGEIVSTKEYVSSLTVFFNLLIYISITSGLILILAN